MTPEEATAVLHARPCPGCGCEPEVHTYYRDKATGLRRGYHCTCGAVVIDGMMTGQVPV